jgi:hypothetical protein
MSSNPEGFEWLDASQARERFTAEKDKGPSSDAIDMTVIGSAEPELIDSEDVLFESEPASRPEIEIYKREVQQHLDELWVIGTQITDEELKNLGPYLAREAPYRESAVFHLLRRRRAEVPAYMKRFVTLKKSHVLLYGLAAQAGLIIPEQIQNDQTTSAIGTIKPLVESNDFEDSFMGSDLQRRVLRALHYVLSEPDENTHLHLDRYKRQVAESGPMSAGEIVGRTYNFAHRQLEKHQRQNPTTLETEENLVQLLEEGRLHRIAKLGSRVLVEGLGVIAAEEWKNGE